MIKVGSYYVALAVSTDHYTDAPTACVGFIVFIGFYLASTERFSSGMLWMKGGGLTVHVYCITGFSCLTCLQNFPNQNIFLNNPPPIPHKKRKLYEMRNSWSSFHSNMYISITLQHRCWCKEVSSVHEWKYLYRTMQFIYRDFFLSL